MKTVNTNKSVDTSVEEEQEDIALMDALQSGLATEDEKRDFESWLFTIER
ncbi:MAG: hypothetical protein J7619_06420 [Dyadobacter sp.]|nr:hypothetical protein [Dyadobacter sp.]MBO9612309.1 hypothetical protein [Dyadobacter sp.]